MNKRLYVVAGTPVLALALCVASTDSRAALSSTSDSKVGFQASGPAGL